MGATKVQCVVNETIEQPSKATNVTIRIDDGDSNEFTYNVEHVILNITGITYTIIRYVIFSRYSL